MSSTSNESLLRYSPATRSLGVLAILLCTTACDDYNPIAERGQSGDSGQGSCLFSDCGGSGGSGYATSPTVWLPYESFGTNGAPLAVGGLGFITVETNDFRNVSLSATESDVRLTTLSVSANRIEYAVVALTEGPHEMDLHFDEGDWGGDQAEIRHRNITLEARTVKSVRLLHQGATVADDDDLWLRAYAVPSRNARFQLALVSDDEISLIDESARIRFPGGIITQIDWTSAHLPVAPAGSYQLLLEADSIGQRSFDIHLVDSVDDIVFKRLPSTSYGLNDEKVAYNFCAYPIREGRQVLMYVDVLIRGDAVNSSVDSELVSGTERWFCHSVEPRSPGSVGVEVSAYSYSEDLVIVDPFRRSPEANMNGSYFE